MIVRYIWPGIVSMIALVADSPLSASPQGLQGSAPTIAADLARQWATDYEARAHGASVDVPPPYGPPQGALSPTLSAFLDGRLDFAFMTRRISDSDAAAFRRAHGYGPLVIPIVGGSWKSFGFVDPVVVIVNARNPVRGLNFAQLDAIFSKSRRRGHAALRTWGELGWNTAEGRPIHLAGGADWSKEDSARGGAFRDRVMLGGSWRDDPDTAVGGSENDVPARVAADPSAIGFTGLGHIVAGERVVPIAPGRSNSYVSPTFEAVASARYPLARTVDLIVARRPGTCLSSALRSFIRYLLSRRGQGLAAKEGHFLPLTGAQSRRSWLRASSCS